MCVYVYTHTCVYVFILRMLLLTLRSESCHTHAHVYVVGRIYALNVYVCIYKHNHMCKCICTEMAAADAQT